MYVPAVRIACLKFSISVSSQQVLSQIQHFGVFSASHVSDSTLQCLLSRFRGTFLAYLMSVDVLILLLPISRRCGFLHRSSKTNPLRRFSISHWCGRLHRSLKASPLRRCSVSRRYGLLHMSSKTNPLCSSLFLSGVVSCTGLQRRVRCAGALFLASVVSVHVFDDRSPT